MRCIIVILLVTSLLFINGPIFEVDLSHHGRDISPMGSTRSQINVPGDHDTIQEAIDAANPSGDTINVAAGVYQENIIIPTGTSIRIIGAGADSTTIFGNYTNTVITVDGDGCTINGVKVIGSGMQPDDAGISLHSDNNTIENCIITRNNIGIFLKGSHFNTLANNSIENNYGTDTYTSDAIGHWKMDETSWSGTAGEVQDASDNGNDGTAKNGITTTSGKFGNCGDFDQTGYVEIPDNDDIEGMAALTIMGWYFADKDPTSDEYFSIVSKGNYGGAISYFISLNGPGLPSWAEGLRYGVRTTSGDSFCNTGWSSRPSTNSWHHFAMTWESGSNMKAYLDFNLIGTSTARTGTISSNILDLRIGSSHGSGEDGFDGKIDDIRIYDRVLSIDDMKKDNQSRLSAGLHIERSDNNTVTNNTIDGNSGNGVSSYSSNRNNLKNNTIMANYCSGLFLQNSSCNKIMWNNISSNHGCEPVTNGLVGYWRMNEESWGSTGKPVKDSTGFGNDGWAKNGVTTSAGKYGYAGDFDGTDDYVQITDDGPISLDSERFTVEAWFYCKGGSETQLILCKRDTPGDRSANYYLCLRYITGNFYPRVLYGYNPSSASIRFADGLDPITLNEWHHILGKYDGVDLKLFLDGVEVGSTATTDTPHMSNADLFIGTYSSGDGVDGSFPLRFNGFIDEVKILNRSLSEEEVVQEYINGIRSGIHIVGSDRNLIMNNSVEFNPGNGLCLNDSNVNRIFYNTISENNGSAVCLEDSSYNEIIDNQLESNDCYPHGYDAGLVGHWNFDESSWSGVANEVKDVSGLNNHGSSNDGASIAAGHFNNAGEFDGNNDYVEFSNEQNFDLTSDFHIEMWINHNSSSYSTSKTIISKTNTATNIGHSFYLGLQTSGTLRGRVASGTNDNYLTSPDAIPSGEWVHIAFRVSSNELSLFVNSTLVATTPKTITIQENNAPLRIGRNPDSALNYCFEGLIDNVKIYDRILSNSEIQNSYLDGVRGNIHFRNADNNVVQDNVLMNSEKFGIRSNFASGNNEFERNYIINTNPGFSQAHDDGTSNFWDNGTKGNYWSDWQSPDITPEYGIVDKEYLIDGLTSSHDEYPFCLALISPDNTTAYENVLYDERIVAINGFQTGQICFEHNAPWLSTSPDGSLTGTPTNSAVGSYWINASASDRCKTAYTNFTLYVINTNDPPSIDTNDITLALEDELYAVEYQATDIDVPPDVLTWSLQTNANFLSMNESGNLSGTPLNEDVGIYWVNVSVSDGAGGVDYHRFDLEVRNVNDDPIIITDPPLTTLEDELYTITFEATDIDPTMDTFSWSLDTNASFLSIDQASGNLSGTPKNDDVGPSYVNVSVSDGKGGSDHRYFNLDVINVNDSPSWETLPPTETLDMYQNYTFDVNASDEDAGTVLRYDISSSPNSSIKIDPVTGLIEWIPDSTGLFEMNLSVTDGVVSLYYEYHLNVILPFTTILDSPEDEAELIVSNPTLTWSISDPRNYIIIYELYCGESESEVENSDPSMLLSTSLENNSFTFTNALAENTTYYWTVIPKTGQEAGICESGVWSFTILDNATLNSPPIFESEPELIAYVGHVWRYYPNVTDADGDHITIELIDGPDGLSIYGGTFTWTPSEDQIGDHEIVVGASDGYATARQTFSVNVLDEEPVNRPPTIQMIPNGTIRVGDDYSYHVQSTDPDGDQIIYTVVGPTGLTIDDSGYISWTPGNDDVGNHTIVVEVSDGDLTNEVTYFITVESGDEQEPSYLPYIIVVMIIILLLIISGVVIFLLLRRRRTDDNEEEVDDEEYAEVSSENLFIKSEIDKIQKKKTKKPIEEEDDQLAENQLSSSSDEILPDDQLSPSDDVEGILLLEAGKGSDKDLDDIEDEKDILDVDPDQESDILDDGSEMDDTETSEDISDESVDGSDIVVSKLRKISKLKDEGIITEKEFDKKKQELLEQI